jgi:hypothetical protein
LEKFTVRFSDSAKKITMHRQCRIFQSENNRTDKPTNYISYIVKIRTFMLRTRIRHVYTPCMAHIAARSHLDRLPMTDGRSAEARYLRRIRADLIAQCGGTPTATQFLLIDRIAALSSRVRTMDCDPLSVHSTREYLDATATLGQLLTQLGVQAAPPANIRRRPFCEAAA